MMYMTKTTDNLPRVAVIGGGAAGLAAAASAAEAGAAVTLIEKNKILGKKLRITGKGRCNVTNDCTVQEFLTNVTTNPRFLWPALSRMSPADTMAMFESLGVPLKTERGKRVFPVSDRANDIADAMTRRCYTAGVSVIHDNVTEINAADGHIIGISTPNRRIIFDSVIICTGGLSYPLTGSNGDGYRLASTLGHNVTPLLPSLVPIVCEGRLCAELEGLSLKNTTLKIVRTDDGKTVYDDFGEMLFTHFGISGPMALSASAHIPDLKAGMYEARIDLKPALDEVKLDTRLLSDFTKYQNRDLANALDDLLPRKLIPVIITRSGIDPRKKVNAVTREERHLIGGLLKCFRIKLREFRPVDEAIITKGGVDVRELNPKTLESRLVRGLFFAGEIIDVDAYTGGFNLQIAFSTGTLAGESAADITKDLSC